MNHFQSCGLQIITVLSHPLEQNTYIAWLPGNSECVVIDPGLQPEKIVQHLEQRRLTPAAVLNTHGHVDHIGGNAALKTRWPECQIVIGAAEAAKLTDARQNLSIAMGLSVISPPADVSVNDGERYKAAGIDFQVLALPGHSPGHVVYRWDDQQSSVVFVGDVIFAGSVGRTDFADGNSRELVAGIRSKLFTLPDATILLPGHGPATTVGDERRTNPYVGDQVRRCRNL
ncbi:MAG: MBL fold metallo-hydrolase [Thermoguttaceae bacterium]